MIHLSIKPLSVNQAWRGRRFKTDAYKGYEKHLLLILPVLTLPDPPFKVTYEFGFSNISSDLDNGVKQFQDILQKKYGFNDSLIYEMHLTKTVVKKGQEFIKFNIEHLEGEDEKNEKAQFVTK